MWLSIWDNRVWRKSVAFGSAVFNNQESGPDSHTLYFLIWGIFTQITQAGLIWVEIQIIEEGCNCRRRRGHSLGTQRGWLHRKPYYWSRIKSCCSATHAQTINRRFRTGAGAISAPFHKDLSRHGCEHVVVICTPTHSITRKMWLLLLLWHTAVWVTTWRMPQGISQHIHKASSFSQHENTQKNSKPQANISVFGSIESIWNWNLIPLSTSWNPN